MHAYIIACILQLCCFSKLWKCIIIICICGYSIALALSLCSPVHKQTLGQGYVNLYHDGVLIIN